MLAQAEHPRWKDPRAERLRVGYFIDWLDGRSEERAADDGVIADLRSRNAVIGVAAGLSGRFQRGDIPGEFWMPHPHVDHALEYGVDYHAEVVRAMADDELADAAQTYERLLRQGPGCISALVNRAEVEIRSGTMPAAENLLLTAADHALDLGERHGIPDVGWIPRIRLTLGRFGLAPSERAETILAWLDGDPMRLAARLALLKDGDRLGRAAHALAPSQARERLRAAIDRARLAPVRP